MRSARRARLSTQISIAGRLLVFSCRRTITWACRKKFRRAARCPARTPAGACGEPAGGFILRTNGEDATDAELAEDIAYLRKTRGRTKEARGVLRPCRYCTRT